MADSLRDQLIAAGFEAPKKPEKKSRPKKRKPEKHKPDSKKKQAAAAGKGVAKSATSGKSKGNNAATDADALERKKLKAQIKELIDNNKLEDWKGEITYRYLVDKRIRELFVNENTHKQLTARETAITRLNGDTYLVPFAIAMDIKKINPQWSIFNTDKDEDSGSSRDDTYSEFQVPDDLQW